MMAVGEEGCPRPLRDLIRSLPEPLNVALIRLQRRGCRHMTLVHCWPWRTFWQNEGLDCHDEAELLATLVLLLMALKALAFEPFSLNHVLLSVAQLRSARYFSCQEQLASGSHMLVLGCDNKSQIAKKRTTPKLGIRPLLLGWRKTLI